MPRRAAQRRRRRGERLAGAARAATTIAARFLAQLGELMATLRRAASRFVRGVKPNDALAPDTIDAPLVLAQLVCSGVMAALDVRRSAFSTTRSSPPPPPPPPQRRAK